MATGDLANLVLLGVSLLLGAVVLLPRARRTHRPWGFRPLRRAPVGLLTGVALGVGTVLAGYAVLAVSGIATTRVGEAVVADLAVVALGLLVLAVVEELIFRGVLQNSLLELTGRTWLAVVVTALAVATPYAFTDGVGPLSLLSATLAGVMYGLTLVATTSVWAAGGLRFAWNLTWGPLLGFTVSGESLVDRPLLEQQVTGPDWLTGGAYGPEAGVVVISARLALIGVLLAWIRRNAARRKAGASEPSRP